MTPKALALCALLLVFPLASLAHQFPHRFSRQRSEKCSVVQIEALEPTNRFESEAGLTEIWDHNHPQFQCAGISASRSTIQSKGLLVPSSSNSPRLLYVIQGSGIGGIVIPGCPVTYSSFQESSSRQIGGRRFGSSESTEDQHQKVHHLKRGDVVAIPAGVASWMYNNGDNPLVVVTIMDTSNYLNQLDNSPRMFQLGGSSLQHSSSRQHGGQSHRSRHGGQQPSSGSVFDGFSTDLLSDALGISRDTASKLQSQQQGEQRGMIIRVEEGLRTIRPKSSYEHEGRSSSRGEREWESEMRRGRSSEREWEEAEMESERRRRHERGEGNGIEETLCSLKFKINIGNPIKSDVYSREAGHITSLNGFKLPILNYIQLSAEKGRLRRNAVSGPKWNVNSHSINFVISGSARVQIVDSSGNSVMDERVSEGQMFVVPQNFAVIVRAEQEDFDFISFHTSGNPVWNDLAGKGSTLMGIPLDVLANSYQISREEARRLKEGRSQELAIFVPSSSSSRSRQYLREVTDEE